MNEWMKSFPHPLDFVAEPDPRPRSQTPGFIYQVEHGELLYLK
jgi:hypothetical protein